MASDSPQQVEDRFDDWLSELEELAEAQPRASFDTLLLASATIQSQLAHAPKLRAELERRYRDLRRVDGLLAASRAQEHGWLAIPGFDVLELIGHGGMGAVYRARQLSLERDVALKVMLGGRFAAPRVRERFIREARTGGRLQHPNITYFYESGEAEGLPYIAQEFVMGGTLGDRIAGSPQPARHSAELLATLADAVHYAHQNEVIHRDLKPTNILLAPDGQPKIADFGLAKALDDSSNLTQTGESAGTPPYMAPEQFTAGTIGPHTDVYGLGAVLFECLTGRAPFVGKSNADLFQRIQFDVPPSPAKLVPAVPNDLAAIVLKCLEKQPAQRYASAGELSRDLRRYLDGEPTVARPPSAMGRVVRWARRSPWIASLTATIVLLLASLGMLSTLAAIRIAGERSEAQRQFARAEAGERAMRAQAASLAMSLYASEMQHAFRAHQQGDRQLLQQIVGRYEASSPWRSLRGFEWHYLKRLAKIEPVAIATQHGEAYAACFLRDDMQLATGGQDGAIRIWDVTTGALVEEWKGHTDCINDLVVTPDGKHLASISCDATVRLWDLGAHGTHRILAQQTDRFLSLAIDPTGSWLAVGANNGMLRVLSLPDGDLVAEIPTGTTATDGLAFSPDAQHLAAVCAIESNVGKLATWNTETWMIERTKPIYGTNLSIRKDSQLVAICRRPEIIVTRLDGSTESKVLPAKEHVHAVAFSRDGRHVMGGSEEGTIQSWHADTGELETEFRHRRCRICDVEFSQDGSKLVATDVEGTASLWSTADFHGETSSVKIEDAFVGPCFEPGTVAISADLKQVLVRHKKNEVLLWEPFASRARDFPQIHTAYCVLFHEKDGGEPDVYGLAPDSFELMRMEGGLVERIPTASVPVMAIAALDHPTLATLETSGRVTVTTEHGPFETTLAPMVDWKERAPYLVTKLACSFKNNLLAVSYPELGTMLVDTKTGRRQRVEVRPDQINELVISPDARHLAVATNQQSVLLFEAATGRLLHTLPRPHDILSVAFSSDGKTLAAAGAFHLVPLWYVNTGQELTELTGPFGQVTRVRFSSDGTQLAAFAYEGPSGNANLYTWSTSSERTLDAAAMVAP